MQEAADDRRRLRLREEVALTELTADLEEPLDLIGVLHALGHGGDAERSGQRGDMAHDRLVGRAFAQSADVAAVELEQLEVEVPEVTQRRVAGAEVVERHADTEFASRRERGPCRPRVGDQRRLGQLQVDERRIDAAASSIALRRSSTKSAWPICRGDTLSVTRSGVCPDGVWAAHTAA